jgi:hypothetical protein
MRLYVDLRDEDEEPLRALAIRDHRSMREQGGFLLHLKIREELAQQEAAPATETVSTAA